MTHRVLSFQISHETNTFSRQPATLAKFRDRQFYLGPDIAEAMRGTNTEMGAHLAVAEERGWSLVQPISCFATPSGPCPAADWKTLMGHVAAALDDGPYDGVLAALHGAMVCEGEDDAEGALLALVRERLGPDVPVILTLDLHANVTDRMAALSNVVIAYRTYPHVDMGAIGREAAERLGGMMDRGDGPAYRSVVRRPASLIGADLGRTTDPDGPMPRLLAEAERLRASVAGLETVAICAGFPWCDIEQAGPSVTVSGLASKGVLGAVADHLCGHLWESRDETTARTIPFAEAMALAQAGEGTGRPLIIADVTDNPGMGSYGDHVGLLRAMIDAGLSNALFAKVPDPAAVEACFAAGEGASLTLTLGSVVDPDLYGPPLQAEARVERLSDGAYRNAGPMFAGLPMSLGRCALVRIGGVRVILSTRTLQVMDPNLIRALGVEPDTVDTLAVKSAQHFRAAFGPMARQIVLVDSGALSTPRLETLPFHRLRRPIYPLDRNHS